MNQKFEQNIIGHFSERVKQYDNISAWVTNKEILNMMVELFPEEKKEYCILDLGAGTGAVAKYVLENYKNATCITALDCCLPMLKKINQSQIKIVEANAEDMPFENETYDIVVSRQCLHYIDNLDLALGEVRRVLKESGIFVLGQIVPYDAETANYWKNIVKIRQPLRKWFFTAEEWNRKLEDNGFRIIETRKCSHKGSLIKWIQKYNISDENLIYTYQKALLNADENYKKIYEVERVGNDFVYNAFWHIVKCEKELKGAEKYLE